MRLDLDLLKNNKSLLITKLWKEIRYYKKMEKSEVFKYNGISLAIYETSRGYTINNINFYNNVKELKTAYKTLAKKMSGKISY